MKRRTVLSILLALVLVCMGILSSCGSQGETPVGTSQTEASGKPDEKSDTAGTPSLTYELLSDGTYGVGAKKGTVKLLSEIVIPVEYQGKPVTQILDQGFYECANLTSVTLPESIISIGYYGFFGCSKLTSITIPSSVMNIGLCAFDNCGKLYKQENYQEEYGVEYLDNWAIECDSSVTNVKLRKNTKGIAGGAFSNCKNLTKITIQPNLISIGDSAFSGCSSLTSIAVPSSVTSIGSSAFDGCSSLTNITLPESVTNIGDGAFFGCDNLIFQKENGIIFRKLGDCM